MHPKNTHRLFHFPPRWRRFAWWMITLILVLATGLVWGSSTTYKNYIVREDRGWDIMCEPYVVKEGDWIYKLLRQKGEISHADFQDFLGIFQRLNPHVPNPDLLRPGQSIDIPLQKLEHGTLPGQATGVVTIPVVSLSQYDALITQNSEPYKVQNGDTVSKLIAERFGRYRSPSYEEGIALFKTVNDDITDIAHIIIGQEILLPNPSLRDQSWYQSFQDERGEVKAEPLPENSVLSEAESDAVQQQQLPVQPLKSAQIDRSGAVLSEAAAIVGGSLQDKGTYSVPRPQGPGFDIDLSIHPLLHMPDSHKLLFTMDDTIMGTSPEALRTLWPESRVIGYRQDSTTPEIVSAIFTAMEEKKASAPEAPAISEAAWEDQGVRGVVRARWIWSENGTTRLCITPINGPQERTPEPFQAYLSQYGIVLQELLPSWPATAKTAQEPSPRYAIRNVLDLATTDHKTLVQSLARALGLKYSPNVTIEFPYAEMLIQAQANLISAANGREVLLDFGDLYGDTVDAIRRTGPQVVQIEAQESTADVVRKILTELGLPFEENPRFLAADRPAQFNTEITIEGFLYAGEPVRKVLITGTNLPSSVIDLVAAGGTEIIVW